METSKTFKIGSHVSPTERERIASAVHNAVDAVSNLLYETILVMDARTREISYMSLSSCFAQRLSRRGLRESTFDDIVQALSDVSSAELRSMTEVMTHYYQLLPVAERNELVFETDMPMEIDRAKGWVCYRFSPLKEDFAGNLLSFVVVLSLSTGMFRKKMVAIHVKSHRWDLYDSHTGLWHTWNVPALTDMEMSVLSLSAQGLSVGEISKALFRSEDAIKSVRKNIFKKLHVKNVMLAILFAVNNKVV